MQHNPSSFARRPINSRSHCRFPSSKYHWLVNSSIGVAVSALTLGIIPKDGSKISLNLCQDIGGFAVNLPHVRYSLSLQDVKELAKIQFDPSSIFAQQSRHTMEKFIKRAGRLTKDTLVARRRYGLLGQHLLKDLYTIQCRDEAMLMVKSKEDVAKALENEDVYIKAMKEFGLAYNSAFAFSDEGAGPFDQDEALFTVPVIDDLDG
eukprot:TRINITY_DN4601_c0_g1_i1.p2 TRINITY_DN4601_c0_g1~~TRINITY_DN4601_c0_g1_i1.p2  ORF type:complete len:206 (-),score=38.76 TRINITY_DN4601_c0_g1_i1:258-875(-)